MKKSSIKNRIIGLSATIGLSAIAVAGLTIGVLAATTQSAKNNFTVNYVANNVSATISAHYKTKNGTDKAMETAGGDTSVTFTASQSTATASFMPNEESNNPTTSIVLTANDNYVILKNAFTNNIAATLADGETPSGGRYLVVSLNDQDDYLDGSTNVNITYFASNYGSGSNYEAYSKFEDYGDEYDDVRKTYYVAPGETFYIYTLIEIDDLTLPASVTADSEVTPFTLSTETAANVAETNWATWVSANEDNWGPAPVVSASLTALTGSETISSGFTFEFDTTADIADWIDDLTYSDGTYELISQGGTGDRMAVHEDTNYFLMINDGTPTILWAKETGSAMGGALTVSQTGWQNLTNSQYEVTTMNVSNPTINDTTPASWNGVFIGKVVSQNQNNQNQQQAVSLSAFAVNGTFGPAATYSIGVDTSAAAASALDTYLANSLTYEVNDGIGMCNLLVVEYDDNGTQTLPFLMAVRTGESGSYVYTLMYSGGSNPVIYSTGAVNIQDWIECSAGFNSNISNGVYTAQAPNSEFELTITTINDTTPNATWNGVIIGNVAQA